jgi:hypothetical protein
LTNGTSYTFTVDFYGTTDEPYTMYFATTGGAEQGTSTDWTGAGRWERKTVTWACDSTASYRLYITKNNDNNTDVFYIDGVMCFASAQDTSYFDGDSEGFLEDGHYWTGTAHASTSVRTAQERSGGQPIDLDATAGLTVENPVGTGMPAVTHHTQGLALLPGAEFVGYKVMPRIVELSGILPATSEDNVLERRKDVIDLIKPDRVKGAQPFILRHTHTQAGVVRLICA